MHYNYYRTTFACYFRCMINAVNSHAKSALNKNVTLSQVQHLTVKLIFNFSDCLFSELYRISCPV